MNRVLKSVLMLIYVCFSCSYSLNAQTIDPGNRIQLVVNARVSGDPSQRLSYSYSVHSLSQSQQSVGDFRVVFRPPNDSISQAATVQGWDTPGIPSGTGRPFNYIMWWAPIVNQIQPGNTTTGFAYVTTQLPGICDYYGEGNHALPWFPEGMADDSIEGYSNLTPYGPGIVGKTVGSVKTLSNLGPLAFLDSLNSYVTQSRTFGWIVNQSTSDKYTNYFSTVRSQLHIANVSGALATLQSALSSANADSTSLLTSEAYALIRYNSQYLITQLQPSFQVKGGIVNIAGTSTLSVRAKPSMSLSGSDTLVTLTATVRWQSRYSLTLGTVSSPTYGCSKYGAVTTVGSYNYQQFRTTTHIPLNWTANNEYELFTVPVNGSAGVEDFTLTNALSGGQWFVDIDYLDKTDSVFYQPVATCTGLTSQNKSDNSGATYIGSRRLAMTSTKLHEVYYSGLEIVYRRKSLTGSWEVTQRISSDTAGYQYDPCITLAHDGSVHVVWQQYLMATTFALWYNRSTDGGTTWGIPTKISGASPVTINSNQSIIFPAIAEYGTSQLVVVCCYSGGLEYNTSSNLGQSWNTTMTSTGAQGGSGYSGYIWFPSLSRITASNKLMVTYDSRYNGVWSQIYNGTSWSTETSLSAGNGTYYDRYASVAADDNNRPIAAWCAQDSRLAEYFIMFKTGNTDGSWGSGFVQFAVDSTGVSDLYPSVTYVSRGGIPSTDIIYPTSNNKIKVNKSTLVYWPTPVVLSNSGAYANTTMQNTTTSIGYPIRVWTDQSANPYQVTLQSEGAYNLSKPDVQTPLTADLHRRIVLESQRTRSTIWFDLAPLKVVTTANDTVVVPFKTLDMTKPFTATIANAWDYLGTDQITLPSNARSLIVETDIISRARQDTLGTPGTNIFTSNSVRFDGVMASQTVPLLSNQAGVSGRKVIDVSQQAGQAITLRMVGTIPATSTEPVTIGVGDVYIVRNP